MYNKRQDWILDFIKDHPKTNRENIEQFLEKMGEKVSKMTINRDLKLLLQDEVITKSGKAKATVYSPSVHTDLLKELNVEDYFAEDEEKRPLKTAGFNFTIFSALHDLLTSKEKRELAELNRQWHCKMAKLSPTLLQREFERLTIELAWKSSQIEGNTYTLLETERLLKSFISARGKTLAETNMVLNHKKALDFVLKDPSYYKTLTVAKIEEIHRLLTVNLGVKCGVRNSLVRIVGTAYRPLDNAYQIKEALRDLVKVINHTINPLEKALIAQLMIAYIQPFEDGNKRTSRILGNALLLANDYCPLSYRSVDEVEYKKGVLLFYEQNSAFYFKQLFLDQFRQAIKRYF